MNSPIVFQIQIPACVDGGELAGLVACSEFLGLWEERGMLTLYWQGKEDGVIQRVKQALDQLNVSLSDSSYTIQGVVPQDWNAQWAAMVHPIRIGRGIGIRPSWETMAMPEDGIEIVLDPRQAFGTGHHATTSLLLEWFEDTPELLQANVLDVGTGSGILCMVALRLGALFARGIDCDPVAIECAKDYAQDNGFAQELDLRMCGIHELVSQSYDCIVANIDQKTICELAPEFSRLSTSHTLLFLSGILEDHECDIVQKLQQHGWTPQGRRAKEGWVALQFVEGSPPESSSGNDSRNVIRA